MISSLEITYENNRTYWGSSDLSQNIFTWTEALIKLSHTHIYQVNCIVKTTAKPSRQAVPKYFFFYSSLVQYFS